MMRSDSSALDDDTVCVSQSLEPAQSALKRHSRAVDAATLKLFVDLAACWRDAARQLELLSAPDAGLEPPAAPATSVRADTPSPSAPAPDTFAA
jgi:hypothetical protein